MFSLQMEKIESKIESIRKILLFKRAVIEFLPKENEWEGGKKVLKLVNALPDIQRWKVYDHSACFNSLYNTFETFVHETIKLILEDYISHTPYKELPEKLIDRHQKGIGELISKIELNRYSHLSIETLSKELTGCIQNKHDYTITPESILMHDNNIRSEILNTLFSNIGYNNINNHLSRCNKLKTILEISEHSKIENLLKEFVNIRNDCSHGETDEILSVGELIFYCDFVEALCLSIADFSNSKTLETHKERNIIIESGEVTETFGKNISVSIVKTGDFKVGKKLFVERNGQFNTVIIEGIQIDNLDKEEITIDSEIEIGLTTSKKIKEGSKLFT